MLNLGAKSLIKASKLIWRNKSVSIMSRDNDSSLSCLIVVLFGFFYTPHLREGMFSFAVCDH
jgi:hypothetical protein